MFSISVIVPTLNDHTLAATLDALAQQRVAPDEIVVAGRDESGVAACRPGVKFFDTGKPVCAAAARNRGILESKGKLLLFTDSDCIPDESWIEKHLQAHEKGHVVVGGAVSLAGANYWAQSDNVSMFHDFLEHHPAAERTLLPTLNLSVRREVIDRVGLLDETFPGAAAEDSDWTIRMRLAGFTLSFEPSATVRHAPARTRWSDIVRHWRNLGYSAVRVRQRYSHYLGTPRLARSAFCLRFFSPLIAAAVTVGIYRQPFLWQYLSALPVVYLTKIIYCFGAAASIDSGFAVDQRRQNGPSGTC
jgi:GT2 family glycosyltransferase